MWNAIRAELAYSRPWLAGGLGIAIGVTAIVAGAFYFGGGDGEAPYAAAGVRGMFTVMAPLIAAYIAQGLRIEERRSQLFLRGSLTPLQIAAISLAIPIIFATMGIAAGAIVMTIDAALTGRFDLRSIHFVAYIGGTMFSMAFTALLLQEAVAAHRQRRRKTALAAWSSLAVAAALWVTLNEGAFIFRWPDNWPTLHLANVAVALAAAIAFTTFHSRRTDFTR